MTEKLAFLEYDSNPNAVINPNHAKQVEKLPEYAVFGFLKDAIDEYAKEKNLVPVTYFKTITKDFPVYVDVIGGKETVICQAPLGAPAAGSFMDWMIGYGVKTIICTGCCGALLDIPENEFLIPVRAVREEGTSFQYLPASRYIEPDLDLCKKVEAIFDKKGLRYEEVTTWTTDGFFRETPDKVNARREEGCATVDMECSALCAVAKFRGASFAQILFTADTLANVDEYNERGWGEDSVRPALDLCIEIIKEL